MCLLGIVEGPGVSWGVLGNKTDPVCTPSMVLGFDTGYPHDGRADKDSYPHDGHADKDSYPHDRHNQYSMLSL